MIVHERFNEVSGLGVFSLQMDFEQGVGEIVHPTSLHSLPCVFFSFLPSLSNNV